MMPRAFRNSSAASRALGVALGEVDQDEVGDARRHLRARACSISADEPRQPRVVVRDGGFRVRACRRSPRRPPPCAGDGHVERPANAVQHVGDACRAIGPAEAQRREAVDLGERARHHRVVRWSRRARCRPRSRCGARTRRRRRRAPAARCDGSRARRRRTSSIGDVGAGRIVRVGEEHDLRARRSPAPGSRRRRCGRFVSGATTGVAPFASMAMR